MPAFPTITRPLAIATITLAKETKVITFHHQTVLAESDPTRASDPTIVSISFAHVGVDHAAGFPKFRVVVALGRTGEVADFPLLHEIFIGRLIVGSFGRVFLGDFLGFLFLFLLQNFLCFLSLLSFKSNEPTSNTFLVQPLTNAGHIFLMSLGRVAFEVGLEIGLRFETARLFVLHTSRAKQCLESHSVILSRVQAAVLHEPGFRQRRRSRSCGRNIGHLDFLVLTGNVGIGPRTFLMLVTLQVGRHRHPFKVNIGLITLIPLFGLLI